jgi:biopolymer transport protein ExbB/TolQ
MIPPTTAAQSFDFQLEAGAHGAEKDSAQRLAWMMAAVRPAGGTSYHYLLLLRFSLANLLGLALLAAAGLHGMIGLVWAADQTHLVGVIFLTFLVGLGLCALRIWQTSRELNRAKTFDPLVPSWAAAYLAKQRGRSGESRGILASILRLKLSQRIAVVRQVAGSLVILGLIGTVLGFIIALSGVDPDKASDFDAAAPMISTLIQGMSTALFTTLVGAVLNVWLMVNYHILAGGTVKLITAVTELGEQNAGA